MPPSTIPERGGPSGLKSRPSTVNWVGGKSIFGGKNTGAKRHRYVRINTIKNTYTEDAVNGASNYLPLVTRTDISFSTGRSFRIPFVASVSLLVTYTS